MAKEKMRDLQGRLNTDYLIAQRQFLGDRFYSWKDRIAKADKLLRGEYLTSYPGELQKVDFPVVMNIADAMNKDVSRLVSEIEAVVRSAPVDDDEPATTKAHIREAVADTYWEVNRGSLYTPQWSQDLTVSGAAFAVAWVDDTSQYPTFIRVDPRYCYPDIHNDIMQDLLVVTKMKVRVVDRMYPDLGIVEMWSKFADKDGNPELDDEVEIWDYYSQDRCVKAASLMRGQDTPMEEGVFILKDTRVDIGCPPAAMCKLPTHDGAFRGMLDQSEGSLWAKNKAAALMVEYTESQVYAPFEAKNVINAGDPPGPQTVYQHDPTAQESFMRRVAPAGTSPQLFALLQYLDGEQRGQLAYPAARQGEVSQSIASAAFVESTQGQLSSVVREQQRLLADLRRTITNICFKLDEKYKDEQKPLIRAVNGKQNYKPSAVLQKQYDVKVIHGPAAGIGVLNADVRLLQYKGAGVVSDDTLRSHIPDIVNDPVGESDRIDRETTAKALQQRFLSDPMIPFETIADVLMLQEEKGLPLVQAVMAIRKQQMAAAPAAAPAAPGQLPGPAAPAETSAAEQALALEKGETPAGPEQLEVEFAPPPMEQIFVGGG